MKKILFGNYKKKEKKIKKFKKKKLKKKFLLKNKLINIII